MHPPHNVGWPLSTDDRQKKKLKFKILIFTVFFRTVVSGNRRYVCIPTSVF